MNFIHSDNTDGSLRGVFVGVDNLNYIKVLIADDHPMLRQGIREGLERQPDFKVVGEASDGEEAVKLAGELKPDVVVMDIGMPKMSGLEATKRVKALNKNIAVVVLTIHDDKEYIQGLLQAGACPVCRRRLLLRDRTHRRRRHSSLD